MQYNGEIKIYLVHEFEKPINDNGCYREYTRKQKRQVQQEMLEYGMQVYK